MHCSFFLHVGELLVKIVLISILFCSIIFLPGYLIHNSLLYKSKKYHSHPCLSKVWKRILETDQPRPIWQCLEFLCKCQIFFRQYAWLWFSSSWARCTPEIQNWLSILHSVEKREILSHTKKNNSSNQLLRNFFSKTLLSRIFFLKKVWE